MSVTSGLISLLMITCGIEYFISLLAVEAVLVMVAFYLSFGLRAQYALTLFMPLTFMPLFIGALCSLVTLSISVDLMRSADARSLAQPDGVLLLGMSAIPVLFGVVLTMPAFMVVVWGRIWLTLQANRKPRAPKAKKETSSQSTSRGGDYNEAEADQYIAELTKRRR